MIGPIGAGTLSDGRSHPSGRAEYPPPWPVGTPMGEHLRVESLMRLAEGRQFYVANNISPKWTTSRKCWSCGNKWSPNLAKCCTYCLAPLRELRMLVTSRWDVRGYKPFEDYVRRRLKLPGMLDPVALMLRDNRMMAVYHWDGERLLLDEPAPMTAERLVTVTRSLAESLDALHKHGVVLGNLGPGNVLVMPDGSIRLFDLDVADVVADEDAVYHHPSAAPRRDIERLGDMLVRLVAPEQKELQDLLTFASAGSYLGPRPFLRALDEAVAKGAGKSVPATAAAYTDLGLVRERNEDGWAWRRIGKQTTLYVVADGMGGHDAGEVASRVAVRAVVEAMGKVSAPSDAAAVEKALGDALTTANRAVRQEAERTRLKMGTTLVCAAVVGRSVVVAHAGDSRAYLFSGGKLKMLTKDHSVAWQLFEAGKITADELRTHPRAHVLTSTVGADDEDFDFETSKVEAQPGDRLVLCSDGLWGEIPDARIAEILGEEKDRQSAVQRLVREAYANGGADNVTVVVADVV